MMARRRERITVDIPVTITTVLDCVKATVVNLTEDGALIMGAELPTGSQIVIDIGEQSLFGRVIWAEVDRIGVRFPFPLCEGPLYDALELARASGDMPPMSQQPLSSRTAFGRRSFG